MKKPGFLTVIKKKNPLFLVAPAMRRAPPLHARMRLYRHALKITLSFSWCKAKRSGADRRVLRPSLGTAVISKSMALSSVEFNTS